MNTTKEQTTYLTVAEVAKLVRRSLKEAFPGVKFSVRSKSYADGSSIHVKWIDGPSEPAVKEVVERFEGGYFDGMTDYKGSYIHELNGKRIDFLCDFIFTERHYSDEVYGTVLKEIWKGYRGDAEPPSVEDVKIGGAYIIEAHATMRDLIYRELYQRSFGDYPGENAVTLKPRVIEKF